MPHKSHQDPEMSCAWCKNATVHYTAQSRHHNNKKLKNNNFLQITQTTESGWVVGDSAGSDPLGSEVAQCWFYSSDGTAQETIIPQKGFYLLDEGQHRTFVKLPPHPKQQNNCETYTTKQV